MQRPPKCVGETPVGPQRLGAGGTDRLRASVSSRKTGPEPRGTVEAGGGVGRGRLPARPGGPWAFSQEPDGGGGAGWGWEAPAGAGGEPAAGREPAECLRLPRKGLQPPNWERPRPLPRRPAKPGWRRGGGRLGPGVLLLVYPSPASRAQRSSGTDPWPSPRPGPPSPPP